jgi:hypothetical protein
MNAPPAGAAVNRIAVNLYDGMPGGHRPQKHRHRHPPAMISARPPHENVAPE